MKLRSIFAVISLSTILATIMTACVLYFKTDILTSTPLFAAQQEKNNGPQNISNVSDKVTDGSSALTQEQRQAYTALTGAPYPDIAEQAFAFCEAQKPTAPNNPVTVDGYIDATCNATTCHIRQLNRGFKYIEFSNKSVSSRNFPLDRDQKYSVSYAPKESPECGPWNGFIESKKERARRSYTTPDDQCLIYTPVKEYMSLYEYASIDRHPENISFLTILTSGNKITNLQTGEIIAVTKAVELQRTGGFYNVNVGCRENRRHRRNLQERILKPTKNKA